MNTSPDSSLLVLLLCRGWDARERSCVAAGNQKEPKSYFESGVLQSPIMLQENAQPPTEVVFFFHLETFAQSHTSSWLMII